MLITLIGPPASGKGTLARNLHTATAFKTLSTGDILRQKAQKDHEIAEILATGALLPDHLLRDDIKRIVNASQDQGHILDGYPRTAEQAAYILSLSQQHTLDDLKAQMTLEAVDWRVIILHASNHIIQKRLAARQQEQKRSDDDKLTPRLRRYVQELHEIENLLRRFNVPTIIIDTDEATAEEVCITALHRLLINQNDLDD